MEQQQTRKLAIIDFTRVDGSPDKFGQYLAERLIAAVFHTRRFEVVERRQLEKILRELRLNLSDLINPLHARRLGQLYGVDAIATGSISEIQAAVEVNARLIDTETGVVFGVAVTQFLKTRDVLNIMGRGSERTTPDSRFAGMMPLERKYIVIKLARVYESPDLGSAVVTTLQREDAVLARAWSKEPPDPNRKWYFVEHKGRELGFVHGSYIELAESFEERRQLEYEREQRRAKEKAREEAERESEGRLKRR
jgi:TolB-like protein